MDITTIENEGSGPARRPHAASLLLVEDNDIDAFVVRRLLRKLELDVELVHARNGEEALATIHDDSPGTRRLPSPTVTLIDINMPRMNGLELLCELKRGGYRVPGGPVYVLTTSLNPKDREAVLAHPCVRDYLVKPLDRRTLERVLAEHLGC